MTSLLPRPIKDTSNYPRLSVYHNFLSSTFPRPSTLRVSVHRAKLCRIYWIWQEAVANSLRHTTIVLPSSLFQRGAQNTLSDYLINKFCVSTEGTCNYFFCSTYTIKECFLFCTEAVNKTDIDTDKGREDSRNRTLSSSPRRYFLEHLLPASSCTTENRLTFRCGGV